MQLSILTKSIHRPRSKKSCVKEKSTRQDRRQLNWIGGRHRCRSEDEGWKAFACYTFVPIGDKYIPQ